MSTPSVSNTPSTPETTPAQHSAPVQPRKADLFANDSISSSAVVTQSKSLLDTIWDKLTAFWNWLCSFFKTSSGSTGAATGTNSSIIPRWQVEATLEDFQKMCLDSPLPATKKNMLFLRSYMANPPASGRDHKEVITYYVDNAQMQEFIARIRTHATKDPVIKLELFFCEYTHDKTAGVRHARTVSNVGKSDSEPNHGRLTTQLFDTTNTDHSAEYELAKPEEAPTWGNFINSTFYKD